MWRYHLELKSIHSKFNFVVGLFVLFVLVAVACTFFVVLSQSADATAIGIAGRQQVLIVQIRNETRELIAALESESSTSDKIAALRASRELFGTSLKALKDGGAAQSVNGDGTALPRGNRAVRAQLEKVAEPWAGLEQALAVLTTPGVDVISDAFYNAVSALAPAWQPIFDESGAVVTLLEHQSERKTYYLEIILLAMVLSTLALAWWARCFGRTAIVRPVQIMRDAAEQLRAGDGDLTRRLPDFGDNEIGHAARALNGFLERIQAVLATVDSSLGDMRQAMDAVDHSMDETREVLHTVQDHLGELSTAAAQVNSSADAVSSAANEQAASLEQTSSAIVQMNATIQRNAGSAERTNHSAAAAARQARAGGEAMARAVTQIRAISGKIEMIEEVAYMTNLLAINAAIEAAHAGQYGKGFAVVAQEVRTLADSTQTAAAEIVALTEETLQFTEDAGELLGNIVSGSQETADLVSEITNASQEQAEGTHQIDLAIGQLSLTAQSNAAASEQLSATAEHMQQRTRRLSDAVTDLHERTLALNQTTAGMRQGIDTVRRRMDFFRLGTNNAA